MAPPKKITKIPFHRDFKRPTADHIHRTLNHKIEKVTSNKHDKTFEKLLTHFDQLPSPTDALDWLAQFNEPGQDVEDFYDTAPFEQSDLGKTKFIYYVQIGKFNQIKMDFKELIQYSKCFFTEESVRTLPLVIDVIKVENKKSKIGFNLMVEARSAETLISHKLMFRYESKTDKYQILAQSLHTFLKKIKPKDAGCIIALTEWDLYAENPDLFVAGLALGYHGVAVFSYLRYNPNLTYSEEFWYDTKLKKSLNTEGNMNLILNRTCKLLVHETLHLLGFAHCIYMDCCMNGSGHLQEDYRQSIFLCPIDLKKLFILFEFDPIERYKKMRKFFAFHKLTYEVEWLDKTIAKIGGLNQVKIRVKDVRKLVKFSDEMETKVDINRPKNSSLTQVKIRTRDIRNFVKFSDEMETKVDLSHPKNKQILSGIYMNGEQK